jgi:transposase
MSKRTYRSVEIQKVTAAKALTAVTTQLVFIALDIAKKRVVAALTDERGEHPTIFHFANPTEVPLLLALLNDLKAAGRDVQIVQEPTGTYGDYVLHAAHRAQVPTFLVSPKRTHDAAEMFDGVPSKHDPKDATVIARLHAHKLSKPWAPMSEERRELRAMIDEREIFAGPLQEHLGRVEAHLTHAWPELLDLVDVSGRISVLRWLRTYADPAAVRADPVKATRALRELSRGAMKPKTLDAIVASAGRHEGPTLSAAERRMLVQLFEEVVRLHERCEEVDARIEEAIDAQPARATMRRMLGVATTAVLLAWVGDPTEFGSASALEKGCGLNLKECSSGERQGRGVHITKRGPGVARKYLYLLALRMVKDDAVVRAWYQRRKSFVADDKRSAVVAVMRKLIRALWHVSRGEVFDATKLFDVRRLGVVPKASATGSTTEVAA